MQFIELDKPQDNVVHWSLNCIPKNLWKFLEEGEVAEWLEFVSFMATPTTVSALMQFI